MSRYIFCLKGLEGLISVVIFFKIHETKPAVTGEKSDAQLTRQLFRELWTKFSIIFTDKVFGL
jgi:hypothetical protein